MPRSTSIQRPRKNTMLEPWSSRNAMSALDTFSPATRTVIFAFTVLPEALPGDFPSGTISASADIPASSPSGICTGYPAALRAGTPTRRNVSTSDCSNSIDRPVMPRNGAYARQAKPRVLSAAPSFGGRTASSRQGCSSGRSRLRLPSGLISGTESRKPTFAHSDGSGTKSTCHAAIRRPKSTISSLDAHFTSASSERNASRNASSTEHMRSRRSRTLRLRERMISSSCVHLA